MYQLPLSAGHLHSAVLYYTALPCAWLCAAPLQVRTPSEPGLRQPCASRVRLVCNRRARTLPAPACAPSALPHQTPRPCHLQNPSPMPSPMPPTHAISKSWRHCTCLHFLHPSPGPHPSSEPHSSPEPHPWFQQPADTPIPSQRLGLCASPLRPHPCPNGLLPLSPSQPDVHSIWSHCPQIHLQPLGPCASPLRHLPCPKGLHPSSPLQPGINSSWLWRHPSRTLNTKAPTQNLKPDTRSPAPFIDPQSLRPVRRGTHGTPGEPTAPCTTLLLLANSRPVAPPSAHPGKPCAAPCLGGMSYPDAVSNPSLVMPWVHQGLDWRRHAGALRLGSTCRCCPHGWPVQGPGHTPERGGRWRGRRGTPPVVWQGASRCVDNGTPPVPFPGGSQGWAGKERCKSFGPMPVGARQSLDLTAAELCSGQLLSLPWNPEYSLRRSSHGGASSEHCRGGVVRE